MGEIDRPDLGRHPRDHSVADPDEFVVEAEIGKEDDRSAHRLTGTEERRNARSAYFCLRSQRVFLRSFLCFFFRIFLRRFLTTEPISAFQSVPSIARRSTRSVTFPSCVTRTEPSRNARTPSDTGVSSRSASSRYSRIPNPRQ